MIIFSETVWKTSTIARDTAKLIKNNSLCDNIHTDVGAHLRTLIIQTFPEQSVIWKKNSIKIKVSHLCDTITSAWCLAIINLSSIKRFYRLGLYWSLRIQITSRNLYTLLYDSCKVCSISWNLTHSHILFCLHSNIEWCWVLSDVEFWAIMSV